MANPAAALFRPATRARRRPELRAAAGTSAPPELFLYDEIGMFGILATDVVALRALITGALFAIDHLADFDLDFDLSLLAPREGQPSSVEGLLAAGAERVYICARLTLLAKIGRLRDLTCVNVAASLTVLA